MGNMTMVNAGGWLKLPGLIFGGQQASCIVRLGVVHSVLQPYMADTACASGCLAAVVWYTHCLVQAPYRYCSQRQHDRGLAASC